MLLIVSVSVDSIVSDIMIVSVTLSVVSTLTVSVEESAMTEVAVLVV